MDNLSTDTTANQSDIKSVISKFTTIKTGFSAELSATGLSIKWKDWSTQPKDVIIPPADFTWLPKISTPVDATNKPSKSNIKKPTVKK